MRFAYWLAARLGWFNVDAMLESGEAGQLAKWNEYHQAEPFGEDWQQTSLMTTQIINAIRSVAVGMSGKRPSKKDFLDWDAFVPQTKPEKKRGGLREAVAALRGMCGV